MNRFFLYVPGSSVRLPRLLAASLALTLSACGGDGAETGCTATEETYGFTEDTSLGFSMGQALAGKRGQEGDLSWGDPTDWLSHDADGETDFLIVLKPGDTVEELRNSSTECMRVLRVDTEISMTTEDGQLAFSTDGVVTVYSRERFTVEATVEPGDLEGELSLPSGVRLRFEESINRDSVEGSLTAIEEDGSSASSVELASWTGSVRTPPEEPEEPEADAAAPPAPQDDDAGAAPPETDSGAATEPDAGPPEPADAEAPEPPEEDAAIPASPEAGATSPSTGPADGGGEEPGDAGPNESSDAEAPPQLDADAGDAG